MTADHCTGARNDKQDGRNDVGDAEDDVLARIGMGQRRPARAQQYREQQNARGRTEITAVDADYEDRGRFEYQCHRMPSVARHRRILALAGRDEDGNRGEREQKGHHLLETLSGRDNSRTAPITPPTAATGAMRLSHGPWPSSSGREPSTDPMPLNTKATVFVTLAVTGGRPDQQQCGIGRHRGQPRDAAGKAAEHTRSGEKGSIPPRHCAHTLLRGAAALPGCSVGNSSETEVSWPAWTPGPISRVSCSMSWAIPAPVAPFGRAGFRRERADAVPGRTVATRRPPAGISVREAAAELGLVPNTASTLVTKLVAEGLLIRSVDAEDRRIGRLRLTDTRSTHRDESRAARRATFAGVLDDLNPEQIDRLEGGLGVLSEMTRMLQKDMT